MRRYAVGRQDEGHVPGGFGANPTAWDIPDEEVTRAARSGASVLVTGPLDAATAAARRIHRASAWRPGPFVIVDCRAPATDVLAHVP